MTQSIQLTSRQAVTVCFSPTSSTVLQVPRALVVSVIAAGIHSLIFSLLIKVGGLDSIYANTVGYLIGGVIQYVLCSLWVFSVVLDNIAVGFITFSLLSLIGLGISDATIWFVNQHLGFHPMLALIAALGLAFCWNFTSRKYLIFRSQQPETISQ